MCLSQETLEGLRMTGIILTICGHSFLFTMFFLSATSFVKMTKYLLDLPGSKFILSERFCQDPLESFFGQQRSMGGHNDNPTVQTFCNNTVSLRVQGTAALKPLHGNCRKRKENHVIAVDETPLPKRKRSNR